MRVSGGYSRFSLGVYRAGNRNGWHRLTDDAACYLTTGFAVGCLFRRPHPIRTEQAMSSSAEDPGHAAITASAAGARCVVSILVWHLGSRSTGSLCGQRAFAGIVQIWRQSARNLGLFVVDLLALGFSQSEFRDSQPNAARRTKWVPWMMFLWTLPFMWIAVTMSVRRVADVGDSPWLGLLVVIPIVNYCFMLWACLRRGGQEVELGSSHSDPPRSSEQRRAGSRL